MFKKLAVSIAAVATGVALLPAATASAASPPSHYIGGNAQSCFYRQSTAYNGVQVATQGWGSNSPANAYIFARARVSTAAACNRRNGVPVVRVGLNRVALLLGSKVLKESGPVSSTSTKLILDSPVAGGIPCTANLRVYVYFSARYQDNSLAGGDFYSPYFRKPGC